MLISSMVLGINIATVTQECILLWDYLFEQWNSNLVIMENVSHWIYLTMWEPVTPSSVLSIPHPQKHVKSFEGTRLWKVCLQTWRTSGRTGSFSLSCCHSMLSLVSFICTTSQRSLILWLPLVIPEEGCSVALSKLYFYEQYWILKTRKNKAMGIV